uniref:Uncharacterized protein n=1 Tax=Solanum tuberosum TaxID=4113 RepID=M0ZS14_SOLTU
MKKILLGGPLLNGPCSAAQFEFSRSSNVNSEHRWKIKKEGVPLPIQIRLQLASSVLL